GLWPGGNLLSRLIDTFGQVIQPRTGFKTNRTLIIRDAELSALVYNFGLRGQIICIQGKVEVPHGLVIQQSAFNPLRLHNALVQVTGGLPYNIRYGSAG